MYTKVNLQLGKRETQAEIGCDSLTIVRLQCCWYLLRLRMHPLMNTAVDKNQEKTSRVVMKSWKQPGKPETNYCITILGFLSKAYSETFQ